MLPNLANNDSESGQERPCLPSIRDLFGEDLSKPVNKKSPSPFSLADLGSSLPSRSSSPSDGQGSILPSTLVRSTSPRSARSQASGQHNFGHAWTDPYGPRRHSDSGPQLLKTSSTSSGQDDLITLPPIYPSYSQSHRDTGRRASSPYIMTSSRRISNSHSRSRSTSEAMSVVTSDSHAYKASLDPSAKRRHTIGSSRSSSLIRHATELATLSRNTTATGPPFPSRPPVTNPYPPAATHPSLPCNLSSVVDYPSSPSCPPSPPSTSGEEVPTERKTTPAKYQCLYCTKRFNRPSSLKLHHNTHTGEKPFACPFPGCGRHFSVMSNMRRHARIHGEPSKRTPYEYYNFEATAYSSSSSTHDTPTTPQTATISSSEPHAHSHSSSATSLSHFQSFSVPSSSRLEGRRHQSLARRQHYPYGRSQSPLSNRGGSSPER